MAAVVPDQTMATTGSEIRFGKFIALRAKPHSRAAAGERRSDHRLAMVALELHRGETI
jgi:hypothetical protein